jgi:hypothetical protein
MQQQTQQQQTEHRQHRQQLQQKIEKLKQERQERHKQQQQQQQEEQQQRKPPLIDMDNNDNHKRLLKNIIDNAFDNFKTNIRVLNYLRERISEIVPEINELRQLNNNEYNKISARALNIATKTLKNTYNNRISSTIIDRNRYLYFIIYHSKYINRRLTETEYNEFRDIINNIIQEVETYIYNNIINRNESE